MTIDVPHGIRAEQPVERRGFVSRKAVVASHAPVQQRLRRERGHEVVRAPDERDADAKAVVRARATRSSP
jgi:hypothetical protein